MRAATVVQVLHGLFYVLLPLLVVTAIILSFIVSFIASFIVFVIHPLDTSPVGRGRCSHTWTSTDDARRLGLNAFTTRTTLTATVAATMTARDNPIPLCIRNFHRIQPSISSSSCEKMESSRP